MNNKPLYTETGKWENTDYELELYELENQSSLPRIDQVQAVCFLNSNRIVFYKHKDGWLGNPGGTVEFGEPVEEALRRELIEEAQLKLIDWQIIGVEIIYYPRKAEAKRKSYFLRVAARVELIDKKIQDPDGKAVGRKIIDIKSAPEKLDWGKKGEILIKLAIKSYEQYYPRS